MKKTVEQLQKTIQTEVEQVLEEVGKGKMKEGSAYEMERSLFKFLLQLGLQILTLYFLARSQASERKEYRDKSGKKYHYQGERKRNYDSIFGRVEVSRPYFYRAGKGGVAPLDAELSLGEECQSDLLREVSEMLSVVSVYHKSAEILGELFGLEVSTRRLAANVAEDAQDVEAYYEQKAAPPPESEASILVIQGDGKGVPMIQPPATAAKVRLGKGEKRSRKQEAMVTTAYTIASAPRTPQSVVDSLYDTSPSHDSTLQPAQNNAEPPRPTPLNKHLRATLDGKDLALQRLARHVEPRLAEHIQQRVALTDGCEALQNRFRLYFPSFTLILDFLHANEYLWDTATALFGESNPLRLTWMKSHSLLLLSSQTHSLLHELALLSSLPSTSPALRRQLDKTSTYFSRNLPFMDYASYLALGFPIASGVIEGACRHFVKDRCELSGMRWSQLGVEALLLLRSIAENHDWHDYHLFRKRSRHARLYSSSPPSFSSLDLLPFDSSLSFYSISSL
jgi:hypothetical protein